MSVASAYQKALDIVGRLEEPGSISVRRYFGGAALVAGGVQFGIVMGDRFYLWGDGELRTALRALGGQPFVYQGDGKNVQVARYYEVPTVILNDPSKLSEFALQAHRAASVTRRRAKPATRR
jgi:TfoX/Sxy family transcriptional regulator of competence genes